MELSTKTPARSRNRRQRSRLTRFWGTSCNNGMALISQILPQYLSLVRGHMQGVKVLALCDMCRLWLVSLHPLRPVCAKSRRRTCWPCVDLQIGVFDFTVLRDGGKHKRTAILSKMPNTSKQHKTLSATSGDLTPLILTGGCH
jgi:hypothetical protein